MHPSGKIMSSCKVISVALVGCASAGCGSAPGPGESAGDEGAASAEFRVCEYPAVDAAGNLRIEREGYVFSGINDQLRRSPLLAEHIGLRAVTDCASARQFSRGYQSFVDTHPELDAEVPPDLDSLEESFVDSQ